MDPSLKVSLMNHCVICLIEVGDGEAPCENGDKKFEGVDSPSFLSTFNEFWRILKQKSRNNNNDSGIKPRGVGGISLTSINAQERQGELLEVPTLCQLCGEKVTNVDNLIKTVRQQVREVQRFWNGCRKRDGKRFQEFENYLQGNNFDENVIQSTLRFVGISTPQDKVQGKASSHHHDKKQELDKLKSNPVVMLQRLNAIIKREPVNLDLDQDAELPLLQLAPVAAFSEQSMELDDDFTNDSDWASMEHGDHKPGKPPGSQNLACVLSKEEERRKLKAERQRRLRAKIKEKIEKGALSEEELKKLEEQKRRKAARQRAYRRAQTAAGKDDEYDSMTSEHSVEERKGNKLSLEERRKREAERVRLRRAKIKEKMEKGALSEEELKKLEEQRRRKAESQRAYRRRLAAAEKEEEGDESLTSEHFVEERKGNKLSVEERKKREAERKRLSRAKIRERRLKGELSEEELKKWEERKKREAERKRVERERYRATALPEAAGKATQQDTLMVEKLGVDVSKSNESSEKVTDTALDEESMEWDDNSDQSSNLLDDVIGSDSDWDARDDPDNDSDNSISEQDDDNEPVEVQVDDKVEEETVTTTTTTVELEEQTERSKRKTQREKQRQAAIKEMGPLDEEDLRKKKEQRKNNSDKANKARRGRRGRAKEPLTEERLKELEEQRERRNERNRFRKLEKRIALKAGLVSEEEKAKYEEFRKRQQEKWRRDQEPAGGYDKDGKPIYTEKQLERRKRETERKNRRLRLIREKAKQGTLSPEQLQKWEEFKKRNAEKAKFKRLEKQVTGEFWTPEAIKKRDEYNAKRKITQRIQREKARAERGPNWKRKIDKRTLAKMAVAQPLEILVSLRQPVGNN